MTGWVGPGCLHHARDSGSAGSRAPLCTAGSKCRAGSASEGGAGSPHHVLPGAGTQPDELRLELEGLLCAPGLCTSVERGPGLAAHPRQTLSLGAGSGQLSNGISLPPTRACCLLLRPAAGAHLALEHGLQSNRTAQEASLLVCGSRQGCGCSACGTWKARWLCPNGALLLWRLQAHANSSCGAGPVSLALSVLSALCC